MIKLTHLWSNLRESFWFLPALIVAFSAILAVGLIELDSSGSQHWMADWPRLFGAGAAGALGMLATVAGSMTTVVGVTFSMTLVALPAWCPSLSMKFEAAPRATSPSCCGC